MRRAVLDTNVVISALLQSEGPCARLLDLVIETRAVEACVDHRILAEYQDVMLRFAHPATGKRLIAPERAEAVGHAGHRSAPCGRSSQRRRCVCSGSRGFRAGGPDDRQPTPLPQEPHRVRPRVLPR